MTNIMEGTPKFLRLQRIMFIKQDETIQLLDENNDPLRLHGDDKIMCDVYALHVVCRVLETLGIKLDASADINAAEPYWFLERR